MPGSGDDQRRILEAGLARHRAGDWPGAETHYRAALARFPGLADARHLLGLALAQQGRAAEGLAEIEAAIAADPAAAAYRGNLAKLLARLGRTAEAETSYRAVLARQPDDADALYNLAELLAQQRRFPEAIACLRRLHAQLPDEPAVANALAASLVRDGRPDAALPLLEAVTARQPDFAEAQHNRATALADLGRIAESEAAAGEAIRANPGLSGAQWHLGLCRYDAGDLTGAAAAFRRAAAGQPAFPLAAVYLEIAEAPAGTPAGTPEAGEDIGALREAWNYRQQAGDPGLPAFGFKASHLRHALAACRLSGLYLEFGVYTGRSITVIAETLRESLGNEIPVHGFDSFEGLPEDWIEGEDKGAYNAGGKLPEVPDNVWLHPGWFDDSLPVFLRQQKARVAFANIDCDIYSSTRSVLEQLAGRLEPGSVLVFDEYFAYPGWRDHEFKAFQEFAAARGLGYEYLALSPFTRQATLRLT
ncbi:MAG: tetratricopeptide repeat protein [Rhodovibrionaceae bacterium]